MSAIPSPVGPALPHDPASLAPLIERLGGRLAVDDCGAQALFTPLTPAVIAGGFACLLTDLGLLEVRGADATNFLHNQLTNDVEQLDEGSARWFGYCSPKGRLLTTLLGWRDEDGVRLILPRPQAEPIRKRLSMFVLRAKARVTDASDAMPLIGLVGDAARATLLGLGLQAPEPMTLARTPGCTVIGLPGIAAAPGAAVSPRWLLAAPQDTISELWQQLTMTLPAVDSTAWRWTEVRSGIPRIVAGAVEQFVPQMVNLELVGGVSFTKGCYPGQEVVARSQYLGKLRRRMFLAHLPGPVPAPGADVLPAGGGEPLGQVVIAAPALAGGADLLIEARTDGLADARPVIAGVALTLETLPYSVPAP